MEFDRDISLGEGLESEKDDAAIGPNYGREVSRYSANRRHLIAGLIFSVIFHIAIVSSFLRFGIGTSVIDVPSVVQIQLIPSNPLLLTAEEEPEEPEELEAVAAPIEEPAAAPAETLTEERAEESFIEAIEPEPADSQVAEQAESPPLEELPADSPAPNLILNPPTILAIERVVESMESERASRFYSYGCNRLEREAGIRECEPDDRQDFSVLERNSVVEFHSPVREVSRSVATVTTLARNSAAVAGRLTASNLPPYLADYVMEEVEIGIQINSNNGNRVLENMDRMVDQSAAALQARRVFTPWVQQQEKVLRARRAYTKQELDKQNRCADIVMALITLPPSEFAECWTDGRNPLLILNFFGL